MFDEPILEPQEEALVDEGTQDYHPTPETTAPGPLTEAPEAIQMSPAMGRLTYDSYDPLGRAGTFEPGITYVVVDNPAAEDEITPEKALALLNGGGWAAISLA